MIFYRSADKLDANFVIKAFIAERGNWIQYKYIDKELHQYLSEKEFAALLRRGARCDIMALKDNPDVYIGFVLYEDVSAPDNGSQRIVHFLYVKKALRKKGVARAVLEHLKIDPNNVVTTTACPLYNNPKIRNKYKFVVRPDLCGLLK